MPDTYLYFVAGYLGLWIILFAVMGKVLCKLSCLEKKLKASEK